MEFVVSGEDPPGFLPPGAKVGIFHVQRLLGVKATGLTYLAFDPNLQQDAVIRVIPASWGDVDEPFNEPQLHEQVERLVSLGRKVDHVLTFYDHGVTDVGTLGERPYLVRYYAKSNLSHVLRSRKSLNESQATKIAVHVADGLGALHEFGLVHTDVRPANVFRIGSSGRWALADYGLLDLVGVAPRESRFAPPDREYSSFSDVYSYGKVIEVVLQAVPTEPERPARGATRSFLWELNELAAACQHRDPARRPTARAITSVLDHGLDVVIDDVRRVLGSDEVRAEVAGRLLQRAAARGTALDRRRAELAVRSAVRTLARRVDRSLREACTLLESDEVVSQLVTVAGIFIGRDLSASDIDDLADEELFGEPEPTAEELARWAVLDQGWLRHVRDTIHGLVVASQTATRDKRMPDRLRRRFVLTSDDIVERYDEALRHAAAVRRELLARPTVPWKTAVRLLGERGGISEGEFSNMLELGCLVVLDAADDVLVPAFQFDWDAGSLHPVVAQINQLLDARQDPWSAVAWWYAPNPHTHEHEPAALVADPKRRMRLLRAALVATSPAA